MVRKTLAVVVLAMTTLLFGGATAFASDITDLCVDMAGSTGSGGGQVASGSPLANTGAGFDVTTLLFIGIAIIAVGATLAMLSHRPATQAADTAALS
jgi:hypothetical protein